MVTVPDFSVPHTQFWCLWKEDPLGFTIHHPELIMLNNIKSYRHWSALIFFFYHTDFFLFHIKIHEISPGAIQTSNGLKVTCLMSLYFKSEGDTMKNEIPATGVLVHVNRLKTWNISKHLYCPSNGRTISDIYLNVNVVDLSKHQLGWQ